VAFDILTLTPFNVQLGGIDPNLNFASAMPAPPTVGGGSVTDGSDSSYVELGSRYNDSEGGERADLLLCDFVIDPAVHPDVTWMYYSIRVKNEAGYADALASLSLDGQTAWYRTDDASGSRLFGARLPNDVRNGLATSPTWFGQAYNGSPILPGDPGDSTNWLNLPRDWPEMLDPLTTTGLRFGMYVLSSSATRVPLIDVFEVRLVVACVTTETAVYHPPPLRLHPRSDGRGMSSAQRVWPRPPTGAYGRIGPGSLI